MKDRSTNFSDADFNYEVQKGHGLGRTGGKSKILSRQSQNKHREKKENEGAYAQEQNVDFGGLISSLHPDEYKTRPVTYASNYPKRRNSSPIEDRRAEKPTYNLRGKVYSKSTGKSVRNSFHRFVPYLIEVLALSIFC